MSMSKSGSTPPVVFYRYEASPFAAKVENALALKGIPHHRVEVSMTLPRPEITDMLGINYRRIPILAIGNDVYCDSSLIVPALEQHFPPSQGFPSLFPLRQDGGKTDTGMVKALVMFYTDRVVFPLAVGMLPYKKFPASFIEDRSRWGGAPMDIDALTAQQPALKSSLSSHMSLLEEQLSDGREWVLDTISPGYADLSLQFLYGWVFNFRGMKEVFSESKFPKTIAWLDRMSKFIKEKREANSPSVKNIKGDTAAKLLADNASIRTGDTLFDEDEASRLGVKQGHEVFVIPDDNAKTYPTIGKLVELSREEMVVQLSGSAVPSLRCHFPRLNFSIKCTSRAPSKL